MPQIKKCCVPGCTSTSKDKHVSLHCFPLNNPIKSEWIRNLDLENFISMKTPRVCSLHFDSKDVYPKSEGGRARLRSDAIPLAKTSEPDLKRRKTDIEPEIVDPENEAVSGPSCSYTQVHLCETELIISDDEDQETGTTGIAGNLINLLKSKTDLNDEDLDACLTLGLSNKSVQVDFPITRSFCHVLSSDKQLSAFTGISNFTLLDSLVDKTKKIVRDFRAHKLSARERIILTMVKLKLNLTYTVIGILFNISRQLCKNYFFEMLPILSTVLGSYVYFPPSEEISKNMPLYFRNFKDCRIVLDCTEICIQVPKCLCCRTKFYSHFYKGQTVKFMMAVTPAGLIVFCSGAYGGGSSDEVIFEQSGIIDKLDSNKAAVMVDKGFLVDDIFAKHKIKVIRPPFLKNKKQLSLDESPLSKEIAAARVHIERTNQRIKGFQILSGKLDWSLVTVANEIFTLICGLVNLSAPILSDDKFS